MLRIVAAVGDKLDRNPADTPKACFHLTWKTIPQCLASSPADFVVPEKLIDKEFADDPLAEGWKIDNKSRKLHRTFHLQE